MLYSECAIFRSIHNLLCSRIPIKSTAKNVRRYLEMLEQALPLFEFLLRKELKKDRIIAARHPTHTTSLYRNPFNDKVIEICSVENRLTTEEDRLREYTLVKGDKYYALKEK